jgi:hypothetical protein
LRHGEAGTGRQHAENGASIDIEARAANRSPLLPLLISDRLADCSFRCADSFRPIEGNFGSG